MSGVKGQRSGGHNAKTIARLKLEGTYDPSRHKDIRNPEPPIGAPDPPRPLRGEARAEWDRMVTRLTASKTLSTVDDAVLYRYCQLHAVLEKLQRECDALKSTTVRVKKVLKHQTIVELRTHPAIIQYRQYTNTARQLLVEFGLTPAARGRVKLLGQGAGSSDPFDEFDEPTTKGTH